MEMTQLAGMTLSATPPAIVEIARLARPVWRS